MKKIISIVTFVITGIVFLLFIGSLILVSILSAFLPTYDGELESASFQITELSFDNGVSVNGENTSYFYISEENYHVVVSNNIELSLQIGDVIDIKYADDGYGDSFEYPIVMIAKGDIVFLDETTGLDNLIDASNAAKFEMYKPSLITFSVLIGLVGLSIYQSILIKKQNI